LTDDLAPFTTLLDLATGSLAPRGQITERRLTDLKGYFRTDPKGVDEVVYRVYDIPAPETNSDLLCSTTVLEPGDVDGEFFMTRGHFHVQRDRAEIYIALAGDGRLVMATEDGRHTVEPMARGTVNYIPGGWGHRSINVGRDPLIFFAAYIGDAGHDYETIERHGFPVIVVRGEDHGPRIMDNPAYRR
jgi:glucose-6-phosphate isomerase, archaeal